MRKTMSGVKGASFVFEVVVGGEAVDKIAIEEQKRIDLDTWDNPAVF